MPACKPASLPRCPVTGARSRVTSRSRITATGWRSGTSRFGSSKLVRTRHLRFAAILSALAAFLAASASVGMTQEPTANTLTAQERAAGWKLLFDGQTLNGWRIFKAGEPTWWRAIDGTLMRVAGEGELITVD